MPVLDSTCHKMLAGYKCQDDKSKWKEKALCDCNTEGSGNRLCKCDKYKGKWKQKDLCDCGTEGAVTPEQRATNRRTKQPEQERKERYRDALVGRRVVVNYDDDLEEYTGVVACRALGGRKCSTSKEKYYVHTLGLGGSG